MEIKVGDWVCSEVSFYSPYTKICGFVTNINEKFFYISARYRYDSTAKPGDNWKACPTNQNVFVTKEQILDHQPKNKIGKNTMEKTPIIHDETAKLRTENERLRKKNTDLKETNKVFASANESLTEQITLLTSQLRHLSTRD